VCVCSTFIQCTSLSSSGRSRAAAERKHSDTIKFPVISLFDSFAVEVLKVPRDHGDDIK